MSGLVSIIIVTLNAEKTIENAILSVVNQSYSNIECLIIDGLSKDNTVKIAKKYCNDSVTIISEKDSGIYDAMNKGVRQSKGEWLYFLGADDELEPDAIRLLINNSLGFDVIYGNYIIKFENGKEKHMFSLDYNVIPYKVFGNHQSVFMKKNVIEFLGGFNTSYKIVADFDLIQRAYLQGFKFNKISAFIAKFSSGGISSGNFNTTYEWFKICKKNKSIKFPIYSFIYGTLRDIKNRCSNFFYNRK